jgi:hypothetical protein
MLSMKSMQSQDPDTGGKAAPLRAKPHHLALAAVAVVSAAGLLAAYSDDQACVAEQKRILLEGPYHDVPDRAAFAAERWCSTHAGKPGPGYSQ